ncbi:MAG: nucleotidyltransferase domain-containing protein [Candidatus Gracilibacteria bacterium]|jgi:DNA polymerase (family 10)
MINEKISQIFTDIAEMLEVLGENPFRVRAYQRAAEVIKGFGKDLEVLCKTDEKELEAIPGIGVDLRLKIKEIVETGKAQMHEDLKKKVGPGILDMLHVRGIGPKKVKLFMEQLDIRSVAALKAAAESGALATLPGMGEKSQAGILESLAQMTHLKERVPYAFALKEAKEVLTYLGTSPHFEQAQYAGSLRRKMKTIGDIDILATGKNVPQMMEFFLAYPRVKQVLAAGDTKCSVVLDSEMQVDLRVVEPESFGAALFYFTGPKHFNILVRTIALKRGWKINEYGLYDGEKNLASRTEEEIFEKLGLPYLTPDQREDFK